MGVWTEVKGVVTLPKESKLSVEKATKEFFGIYEVCYCSFSQRNTSLYRYVTVEFTFEESGKDACYYIQNYIQALKEKDSRVDIDFDVSTRFLA